MTPPPERGRSGLPRRSFLPPMTAPTPHFRRTAETPLGKIQPDLEGFALAEMSDLLEPLTPAPFVPAPFPAPFPSIQRRASPPDSETGLYKGNHRALAQDRVKAGKHRTPDTKRRRRDELFTPGAPIHSDDLFSRRLADSARRTPLAPLPLEHFDEPAPPRPSSSLAVVTAPPIQRIEAERSPRRITGGPVRAKTGSSRAERARAAGIPVLSTRSIVRPSSRPVPPMRRVDPPRPEQRPPLSMETQLPRQPSPSLSPPTISEEQLVAAPSQSTAVLQSASPNFPLPQAEANPLAAPRSSAQYSRGASAPWSSHVTPHAYSQFDTPPSDPDVSLAPSAATLDGLSELWDLSTATATPTSTNVARQSLERPIRYEVNSPKPSVSKERDRTSIVTDHAVSTSAQRARTPPPEEDCHLTALYSQPRTGIYPKLPISSHTSEPTSIITSQRQSLAPPSQPELRTEDSRRESGSIFGFLTSLFISPPAPPTPPPAPPSPKPTRPFRPSRPARMKAPQDENLPIREASNALPASRRVTQMPPAPRSSSAPAAAKAAPKPHRQPLGDIHGQNASNAPKPRTKRKEPPSPVKETRAPSSIATRPTTQRSYARSTSASRSATQPERKSTVTACPLVQSTAHLHPQPRVTSFVAQRLANLPKLGASATPSGQPVSIADHERARELAIRKAVFERASKLSHAPLDEGVRPAPTITSSGSRSTHPVRVPGEATRRRAEAQVANKERRDRKAAEVARIAAEEARIRAQVEAELDRQARQATVFRANPLPEMYGRH